LTTFIIRAFAARYRINLDEAARSNPADYASFNEFFIRPLKDGARPIDGDGQNLCLPADGRVSECGTIEHGRLLAAEMGEAATPTCEATTAMDSGREGRILCSFDTSTMTGMTE